MTNQLRPGGFRMEDTERPTGMLNSSGYDSVKVLMICWKDTRQHQFETQLKVLLAEFQKYRFDIEPIYRIESSRPHRTLSARLQVFLQSDKPGTLLILYYGGHGMMNKDKENIWIRYITTRQVKSQTNF
jgi:hypothetical protein